MAKDADIAKTARIFECVAAVAAKKRIRGLNEVDMQSVHDRNIQLAKEADSLSTAHVLENAARVAAKKGGFKAEGLTELDIQQVARREYDRCMRLAKDTDSLSTAQALEDEARVAAKALTELDIQQVTRREYDRCMRLAKDTDSLSTAQALEDAARVAARKGGFEAKGLTKLNIQEHDQPIGGDLHDDSEWVQL